LGVQGSVTALKVSGKYGFEWNGAASDRRAVVGQHAPGRTSNVSVCWANDPGVAFIERGDDSLVEAFSDGGDGGVGSVETDAGVRVDELADAAPIAFGEVLDAQLIFGDGLLEQDLGSLPVRGLGRCAVLVGVRLV